MTTQPSRRKFITQAGATATALCLPGYLWAQEEPAGELKFPDVSELVKHLPPGARYVPRPVADGENGYLAFRKALDAVVGTDALDAKLKARFGESGPKAVNYGLIAPETAEFPHGPEGDIVEAWLEENRRARDLAVRASRFSRGQIPSSVLEQEFINLFSESSTITDFLANDAVLKAEELRLLRALKDEDVAEAMNSIIMVGRLHRVLRTASGHLMTALLVMGFARCARRWMRMVARHPWSTPEQVESLRREFALFGEARDWIADFFRAEFHYYRLPLIKFLADARTLQQTADVLIRFRGDFPKFAKDKSGEEVLRSLIVDLLEGHPQPFDPVATVKDLGNGLADYLDGFAQSEFPSWNDAPKEIDEINALWPQEWMDQLGMWTFDFGPDASNFERESSPSPKRMREIRDSLHEVSNPLGKLLFLRSASDVFGSTLKFFAADHGITEVALAGRLFWNRHDRVPYSLQELVDDGWLDAVPGDPFGEGPLKYDPDRAVVWSVSHNGQDDRGEEADIDVYDPNDDRDDIATPMPHF